MPKLVEKAIDGLSHIPGMAWAIAVITVTYAKATGLDLEGSWGRMLGVSLACVIVYGLASFSDGLYESLYDHNRKHNRALPLLACLDAARNRAAMAFFSIDRNETDAYKKAVELEFLSNDKSQPGLYGYAKAVAKQSEAWEGKITLLLYLSKASRTLSLAALLTAGALCFGWIRMTTDFGRAWLHPILLAPAAALLLVGGFALRALHQIALYNCVAAQVGLITLADGRRVLVSAVNTLRGSVRQV